MKLGDDHKLIEVVGKTGFDYVWLDTEHSALKPRALEGTMRTCEAAGFIPIVRIPDPADGTSARRVLSALTPVTDLVAARRLT